MKMKFLNNKKMNTVAKSVVFVMGFSLLTGCSEENVLQLEPFNQISEEAAFSTPSLIDLSVNGMYNAAQRGDYNGAQRGYPFGAAFVQQGDNRAEDAVNTATFYLLTYTATYDPTTANNVFYWSDTYRLINRTNIIIEGVTGAVAAGIISQELGNDYIGQARFLRAAAHLELLFHFARPYNHTANASHPGVPYREISFTTAESLEAGLQQGRGTVAESYSKVIADLDAAEQLLNTKAQRGGTAGIVRATKESAIAMKTRAYLHMRNWPMVITEGNKLAGIYTLTDSPNGPFLNGYNNTESVFSIEHTANNNPGVNAALASQYKRRRLVVISPIIWRNPSWLADDLRRKEAPSVDGVVDEAAIVYAAAGGLKITHKYKDDVNYTDPAPVIRYAEVLLNMAEAYARQGVAQLPDALAHLNMVRNRSLASPATQQYILADLPTQAAMVQAVITERRIEFVCEGRRWPDVHRLQNDDLAPVAGIPAKVAPAAPPAAAYALGTPYTGPYGVDMIPYSDFRFLWPFPQQEINNNPTLAAEQNPGW